MAPVGGSGQSMEAAALARRKALNSPAGPMALMKNLKVFGIACFACLGGLLYGYNQGVFSGVLVMTSFKQRKYSCYSNILQAHTNGLHRHGKLHRRPGSAHV